MLTDFQIKPVVNLKIVALAVDANGLALEKNNDQTQAEDSLPVGIALLQTWIV